MEDGLLRQIVVVTSPTLLPSGADHATTVAALCRDNQLVLLLHFGDERYNFPENHCLPYNARVVHYDYETLDESLAELESYLSGFGVGMISRHKMNGTHLPFVLGGSILQVPRGVQLSFLDSRSELPELEKTTVSIPDAEWDFD